MAELESVASFSGTGSRRIAGLAPHRTGTAFPAGHEIFREGDPGDGVYVIRDGLVEIAHLWIGGSTVCFPAGPGEIFGEMAVIEDLPRSATATAAKDTRVYFIPRDEMLALLQRSPASGV